MFSKLQRNVILPFGDYIFGQRMISRLKFLEKAQWWDPQRILDWQNQSLNSLVQIAYREVPFYREIFDQAGVQPEEIKEPEDLLRLPVITKDMLRKSYPDRTTRKTRQKTYQASTSGSTGKNFYVREDAFTAGWYRATFLLSLEWAGWAIGEPHLQTGITPDRSLDRRLKDWLLRCHYVSAYRLDDDHLDVMLSTLDRYHLKFLFGYPGSLYYLARYAREHGWNQALKSTVTWGDMLYPHYRQEIEEVFQTKVFDTYGCAEGIQISAQCEYRNYHLHAFDAVVEFLDGQGQPVGEGETGNIVVTRLHPGPMPLIRYAIGDLGVPAWSKKCTCGRGLPLMESIKGRDTDVILTPNGNRLIVHFFTGVLEHFNEIDAFQVIQDQIDSIELRVVPRGALSAAKLEEIIQALKEKGAGTLNIKILVVNQIPLSNVGKNRFIVNNLRAQSEH